MYLHRNLLIARVEHTEARFRSTVEEQRRNTKRNWHGHLLGYLSRVGAFLSGVRAAYESMLADTKEDLMEDSSGPIDIYV